MAKRSLETVEVSCRSILSRTRIPGADYCANPYVGCGHGCVYCYAPIVARRWRDEAGEVDKKNVQVKTNAVQVARLQLPRIRRGEVLLSSQTDPYQPAEEKYELTRKLLAELLHHGFSASVLTKSDLVVRDVDLLAKFPRDRCTVGMSVATTDEDIREALEPGAPSLARRLEALRALREKGIRTWAFFAPLLPGATGAESRELIGALEGLVDSILVDRLNYGRHTWPAIQSAVVARGRSWATAGPGHPRAHYRQLTEIIQDACRARSIPVLCCHL